MKLVWGAVSKKTGWKLGYLDVSSKDADFLTDEQYDYVVDQFFDMADFHDPLQCQTVDVRRFEDCFVLHDKGGILGKINLRVYFTILWDKKAIIVLASFKKEAENQVPRAMKMRIERRLEFVNELVE